MTPPTTAELHALREIAERATPDTTADPALVIRLIDALLQAAEQRGRLLRALKRSDALFLEIYSNAQKLPWEDIEQLGKAGLDATAAALAPPQEQTDAR